MSTEQGNTTIDTRHIVYDSSSGASKGRMNFQRPTETLRNIETITTSTIIRAEPVAERNPVIVRPVVVEIEKEAQAANLEVPAAANKATSEASSETSYDSKEEKEKASPKIRSINLEERENKPVTTTSTSNVGVVETKGFGSRDHFLSEGHVIFSVLEAKFRPTTKIEAKNSPYFKFRLGFNSKKSTKVTVEGKNLKVPEEIKVKYTNQDEVRIKVKGKGRLVDHVIASTKVSIVDVIMEGKQTLWAPLLKGDDVLGEMKLEMEFVPKK